MLMFTILAEDKENYFKLDVPEIIYSNVLCLHLYIISWLRRLQIILPSSSRIAVSQSSATVQQ